MKIATLAAVAIASVFSFSASANDDILTKHWEHHFWIIDKVDLKVDVFHFPSGNLRVAGRFSNGQRLLNSEPVGLVYVEDKNGNNLLVKIAEWLPMTRGGGTNVRFKQHDFFVAPGTIKAIKGVAYESATPIEFGVKLSCDENSNCSGSVNYEEFPDRIAGSLVAFEELESFDYCKGFLADYLVNRIAETATVETCDSKTGIFGSKKIFLEKPLPDNGNHKP